MKTVHEVSELTGVSIRALHHYDAIGLLPATKVTEAGYRLYDDTALERLRQILFFKELDFPLNEIRTILDSPGFDKDRALEQQIALLELRRDRLNGLIALARKISKNGGTNMSFRAFDTKKIEEYAKKAKETWGETPAYREYEKRAAGRSEEKQQAMNEEMMAVFTEFGRIKDLPPESEEAVALARKLQAHITENYYACTDEILLSLGQMYASGGEFTENIDRAGGEGTGAFACKAIEAMVAAKRG